MEINSTEKYLVGEELVQSIYKQIITFIEGDNQKAFEKGLLAGMRYADRGHITDHSYKYKSPEEDAFYGGLEIGQIIFSHYIHSNDPSANNLWC